MVSVVSSQRRREGLEEISMTLLLLCSKPLLLLKFPKWCLQRERLQGKATFYVKRVVLYHLQQ